MPSCGIGILGLLISACGRFGFDAAAADATRASDGPASDATTGDAPRPVECGVGDPCNGVDDDCDDVLDEGGCPMGCSGVAAGTHGYMICGTTLSNHDAEVVCMANAAALVRIDDATENDWLRAAANTLGHGLRYIWTGGRDEVVEGEWRWRDGAQFWQGDETGGPTGLYANFPAGEPNDSGNREDCLLVWTDATWRDYVCTDLNIFACESP